MTPRSCGRRLPMNLQRRVEGSVAAHAGADGTVVAASDAFPVARRLAPRVQSVSATPTAKGSLVFGLMAPSTFKTTD
jgi:hypothetical protein